MAAPAKIDRQNTPPFLLRLFYKHNKFNALTDFTPGTRLPPSLQIYTWQSCTLRELSTLLLTALPNLLQKPYPGTRIAFRLVYADLSGPQRPGMIGRYISRELGSVVVGEGESHSRSSSRASSPSSDVQNGDGDVDMDTDGGDSKASKPRPAKSSINSTSEALAHLTGGEPDKTLQDARFVIGDYICAAILPPLADGSVQPAPAPLPTGPRGGGGYNGGGYNGGGRDGYSSRGGGRGGGRFPSFSEDRRGGPPGAGGVPHGEWRRGEAPPERERERERERGEFGSGGGGGGGGYNGGGGGRDGGYNGGGYRGRGGGGGGRGRGGRW